jgi:hypothetical protein
MAASGEVSCPCAGRTEWPLTSRHYPERSAKHTGTVRVGPEGTFETSDSSNHVMMRPSWTRKPLLAFVLVALLAGCGGSNTGVLTGRIGFVGRVPPKSLLSRNQVVVLRGGVPVARQPVHLGQPYGFTLAPGDYTIDLRGTDNTTWGNIGKIEVNRTTHMDLTLVFHEPAPG